ncbi:uncharacterized protein LY79DRAFT_544572 [Colletotrichum navitas]|uniref:Uncharacterized protein n=1 Tax=Colletotrichum navitas TaxID=681940 RepID=A0AAD8Q5N8_9PEZI|nr:uncharacterized protein LY79DRAFT_544572 [Colletotrichum navitas]KAK1596356.1 hypothetical protein LY79DRAFT_544572 [Colletotrichum navitas]
MPRPPHPPQRKDIVRAPARAARRRYLPSLSCRTRKEGVKKKASSRWRMTFLVWQIASTSICILHRDGYLCSSPCTANTRIFSPASLILPHQPCRASSCSSCSCGSGGRGAGRPRRSVLVSTPVRQELGPSRPGARAYVHLPVRRRASGEIFNNNKKRRRRKKKPQRRRKEGRKERIKKNLPTKKWRFGFCCRPRL